MPRLQDIERFKRGLAALSKETEFSALGREARSPHTPRKRRRDRRSRAVQSRSRTGRDGILPISRPSSRIFRQIARSPYPSTTTSPPFSALPTMRRVPSGQARCPISTPCPIRLHADFNAQADEAPPTAEEGEPLDFTLPEGLAQSAGDAMNHDRSIDPTGNLFFEESPPDPSEALPAGSETKDYSVPGFFLTEEGVADSPTRARSRA